MPGFIQDKLEIKFLILYIAARLSDSFDFLVATMMAPQHLGCPYVNGIPFLLGENMGPSERQVLQLMETPSCHLGTK